MKRQSKASQLSEILHRTRNPLLMINGCNPIPEEAKTGKYGRGESPILPAYQKFQELFAEANKVTPANNLVFGLDGKYSDTDKGFGGFYNAGFVPVNLFDSLEENPDKTFAWRWPRDPHSPNGKYMRYQGSVNLGVWPRVLHDAISVPRQYWQHGCSFALPVDISKEDLHYFFTSNIWMHLFTSFQSEFDKAAPDCSVMFSREFDLTKMEEHEREIHQSIYTNRHWTPEQIRQHIIRWQEEHTEKSDMINTPASFFDEITPGFHFDGFKMSQKVEEMHEADEGLFSWKSGTDFHIFGKPRSQQEAKRYISPDSYNGIRGLTPVFCYSDSDHDMTHQFYSDVVFAGDLSPMRGYAKLDSSCT